MVHVPYYRNFQNLINSRKTTGISIILSLNSNYLFLKVTQNQKKLVGEGTKKRNKQKLE